MKQEFEGIVPEGCSGEGNTFTYTREEITKLINEGLTVLIRDKEAEGLTALACDDSRLTDKVCQDCVDFFVANLDGGSDYMQFNDSKYDMLCDLADEHCQPIVEESLSILEGCLIEPILNDKHADLNKRRVVEVQSDNTDVRICGYGKTFSDALADAANQLEAMKEAK